MSMHFPVLIVEDDRAISSLLERSLEQNGYKTLLAHNAMEAKRYLSGSDLSLILLDLGLPDADGKSLIKMVRKVSDTPIIILSARQQESEIIASLDLGADDYVTKPFSLMELLARIRRAQLRRQPTEENAERLTCNDLVLDIKEHRMMRQDTLVKLTPTEFTLLHFFMAHPNQVLTHHQILKTVWGVGYQNEMQYLRSYINTLRKKIEPDSTRPRYIQTEMGVGYRFICQSSGEIA
jgi:two-component system, OmpR family, KDP operon response regulator KdpE